MELPGFAAPLHPVCQPDEELLKDCTLRFLRGSGPGGQHRNKTESAVVLTHTPTGVTGQAAERRSQADNRRMALQRLRVNLALQVRSKLLAEASPTPLWQSRCPQERIVVNPIHHDFAPLLAEALEVMLRRDGQPQPAAEQLRCTSSQLVKFLKLEPEAFALVNTTRARHGLHPLA